MKILLTTGIYPPDIGGPASYVPQLGTYLSESGCEVEVVTLSSEGSGVFFEAFGKVTKLKRGMNKLARFVLVTLEVYRKSRDSNVVFANGLYEECAVSSLFRRRKMVFKIVGDPIWERHRNSNMNSRDIDLYNPSDLTFRMKLERAFFKWCLRRANVITCPGRKLAETVKQNYSLEDIRVIENGTQVQAIQAGEHYEYDIVTVSRLVQWKRIDLLIRAAARTRARMIVIGEGPEEVALKQLSSELNAKVKFVGSETPDGVLRYLRQSRIFALVSSYEGLSFSLLEALSMGKRILVSNIDANKSLFVGTDFAEIVDPEKPVEIDFAIETLMNDTFRNREREDEARKLVSLKFDSKVQLMKMETLIRSTVVKV